MSLQDEIADEYLPDVHVNGMDCPDTESAKEIINKVLDAAMQAIIDCEGRESKFNHIEAIGKLRPES